MRIAIRRLTPIPRGEYPPPRLRPAAGGAQGVLEADSRGRSRLCYLHPTLYR